MCSAQPASPASADRARDRLHLRRDRARGQEVGHRRVALAPGARRLSSRTITAFSACTATGRPSSRGPAHAVVEREVVAGREVVVAAVGHEGLETDHAAGRQLVHALEVPRHDPAPEREVDVRGAARGGQLGVEGGLVTVGGKELSGMSTAQVKPPAASARVPLAKPSQSARPGIVEVHVRVDQAGQHVQPGRVDHLPRAVAQLAAGRDVRDHAVGDDHVDVPAAHDGVETHAVALR